MSTEIIHVSIPLPSHRTLGLRAETVGGNPRVKGTARIVGWWVDVGFRDDETGKPCTFHSTPFTHVGDISRVLEQIEIHLTALGSPRWERYPAVINAGSILTWWLERLDRGDNVETAALTAFIETRREAMRK